MKGSVGGAADRHHHGDRVLKRRLGEDIAGLQVRLQQPQRRLARPATEVVPARVGGGDRGAVGQRHAQRLTGAGHRVGRVHTGAGALAWTGGALQLIQLLFGHPTRLVRADALEHVLDGDVAALVAARHNRAAIQEHGRHVQTRHRHEYARQALIATSDAHKAVVAVGHHHQLDGVGDDLAADEGRLHPLIAHGDAVTHGDGDELPGRAAAGRNAVLHAIRQTVQVDVAGRGLVPGAANPHERLIDVLVGEAHRAPIGAGWGPMVVGPVDRVASQPSGRHHLRRSLPHN